MKLKLILLAVFAAILCNSCGVTSPTERAGAGLLARPCVASVVHDGTGNVTDVVPAAGCVRSDEPRRNPSFVIGHGNVREPIKEVGSYIVFGDGTTTCYGPPIPSPARCVCTATPCP